MGLGGTDFRFGDDIREVDNVYLGTWRPGLLRRLGGFNETMEANEDAEMSARVRKAGYRILRIPLPCQCLMKRGLVGSVSQWHRYGYWRARMLRRNPEFIRMRHIVNPVAAILAFAIALSPVRLALVPAFAAYAVLVFRGRSSQEPLWATLATLAFFPILHFGFAAGMLRGLMSKPAADWPPADIG
jgi:succinoglycan biosynthesis protein ExoA